MNKRIVASFLIIACTIFSCQSNNKTEEISEPVFDIPYLLKLEKKELTDELGPPPYGRKETQYHTHTKHGDLVIPSPSEVLIYEKNGYRVEIEYIPERFKHPIEIYLCKAGPGKADSAGLKKILWAGRLDDSSKFPATVTIDETGNGFSIHNFDNNAVLPWRDKTKTKDGN